MAVGTIVQNTGGERTAMINHVGRTIWASLLVAALGLFAGAPVASASEWYVGGFVERTANWPSTR